MADEEMVGGAAGEDVSVVIGVAEKAANDAFDRIEARIKKFAELTPTIKFTAVLDDAALKAQLAAMSKAAAPIVVPAVMSAPVAPMATAEQAVEQVATRAVQTAQREVEAAVRSSVNRSARIRSPFNPWREASAQQRRGTVSVWTPQISDIHAGRQALSDNEKWGQQLLGAQARQHQRMLDEQKAFAKKQLAEQQNLGRAMAAEIEARFKEEGLAYDRLNAGRMRANAAAISTEKQIQLLQSEARRHFFTGQTLTSTFTVPAAIALGGTAYIGSQLDQRMNKIAALTETPRSQIPGLTDQIVGLSTQLPTSATDLADTMYQISSAGFKGQDGFKVLTATARASASGMGQAKDIADLLTSSLTAYGDSADKATKYQDMLTKAVGLGKGQAEQYAPALGKVVGTAAVLGISFPQITAAVATLSRIGIKPDVAATALNQMISKLAAPDKAATKTLAKIGLTPSDVRKQMSDDATGGLAGFMTRLVQNPKVGTSELEAIVGNVRSLREAMGTAVDQAGMYKSILEGITNSQGASTHSLEEMSHSFDFQWNRMLNVGKATIYGISGVLLPQLTRGLEAVSNGLPTFTSRVSQVWGDLGDLGRMATVAAAGLLVFSGPAFKALALIKDLQAGMMLMRANFTATPIGIGIAAVGGLEAIAHGTGETAKAAQDALGFFTAWEHPLTVAGALSGTLLTTLLAIQAIKFAPAVSDFLGGIVSKFSSAKSWLADAEEAGGVGAVAKNFLVRGGGRAVERDGIDAILAEGSGAAGAGALGYTGLGFGAGADAVGMGALGFSAAALSAAGIALGAAALAVLKQGMDEEAADTEGNAAENKTRSISVNRVLDKLDMATKGTGAEGSIGEIRAEILAAGNDVGALQDAMNDVQKRGRHIGDLHLDPLAKKIVLTEFDELVRQMESKKVAINLQIKNGESIWQRAWDATTETGHSAGQAIGNFFGGQWIGDFAHSLGFGSSNNDNGYKPLTHWYSPDASGTAAKVAAAKKLFASPLPTKVDFGNYGAITKALKEYAGYHGSFTDAQTTIYGRLKSARDAMDAEGAQRKIRADWQAHGSDATGPDNARKAADQSKENYLNRMAQAYDAYGSTLDSVIGKIREFSLRTEEARVTNDLHKRSLDGVSESYKEQAEAIARLSDKMQRIVGVKDLLKNFFAGLQSSILQAGGNIGVLNPSLMGTGKALNFQGSMSALQAQGLSAGASLATQVLGVASRYRQSANNAAADAKDAVSGNTSWMPKAAPPHWQGAPGGRGNSAPELAPMPIAALTTLAKHYIPIGRSPVVTDAERNAAAAGYTGSEFSISSYGMSLANKLPFKVGPGTLDSESKTALKMLLASSQNQEALMKWAKDNGIKGFSTIDELIKLLSNAAVKADKEIKANKGTADFLSDQRERQQQMFVLQNPNDPMAQLKAQRLYGNLADMSPLQWQSYKQGHMALLEGGFENQTHDARNAAQDREAALAKGQEYIRMSGSNFSADEYNRVVSLEEHRLEIWRSLSGLFVNDPAGKARAANEAMAVYRDSADRDAIAKYAQSQAQYATDTSRAMANQQYKLGLLNSGIRPELADIQANAQADYAKTLQEAQADAEAKTRLNHGVGFVANMAEARRTADTRRDNSVQQGLTSLQTNNIARFAGEALQLAQSVKSVGDQTGYAAKEMELYDAVTGKGLDSDKVKSYLSDFSKLQAATESLGLAQGLAQIGSRNDIERLQAQRDVFLTNPATAALSPGARQSQLDSYNRQIAAAQIGAPAQLAADLLRQGEEHISQLKMELEGSKAITDADKVKLAVDQAIADAALQHLTLNDATLASIKAQAEEQLKIEKSLKRQQEIADLKNIAQHGLEEAMAGKGLGSIPKALGDMVRKQASTSLTNALFGGFDHWFNRGKSAAGDSASATSGVWQIPDVLPGKKTSGVGGLLGAIFGGGSEPGHDYNMAVQIVQMTANTVNLRGDVVNFGGDGPSGGGLRLTGKRGASDTQRFGQILGAVGGLF